MPVAEANPAVMTANAENPEPEKFTLSFLWSNQNHSGLGFLGSSEKPLPPPPPCIEVLPSEASTARYNAESVNLNEGLALLKGRVNSHEIFPLSNSDLVPGKYEGGLKLWEGSLDLVKTLRSEIQDVRLSLTGKRVLELGCGHGLPGIFACLEGASVIHFQDFNAEVLQCLTIPNVNANLGKEPAQVATTSGTERISEADVRFFAGDWSEVHQYLLHLRDNEDENSLDLRLEQDSTAGYDIILMAETVYSISSLQNLYAVIKKCLSRPNGVVYMAAKKHYFGVGGGTRQFLSVVGKDGVMVPNLIAEIADGSSNVREVWKLSFK